MFYLSFFLVLVVFHTFFTLNFFLVSIFTGTSSNGELLGLEGGGVAGGSGGESPSAALGVGFCNAFSTPALANEKVTAASGVSLFSAHVSTLATAKLSASLMSVSFLSGTLLAA